MTRRSKASLVLAALAFLLPVAAYLGEWICGFCASDASIFRYIGKCVAEGGVLYQCAWDNKGPLLLLPNALGWLIGGMHGPGFVFLCFGLVSIAGVWAISRRYCGSLPAACAAVLYSTVLVGNGAAKQLNSQEWAAVFFIVLGVWALLRLRSAFGAFLLGIAVGCVFLIKPNQVSFGGAALILWIVLFAHGELTVRAFAGRLAGSFAGFVLTLAGVSAWFAAQGAFFDLWDATLLFGLFEYCKTDQSWVSWWCGYFLDPPRFLWIILHAVALVVLAFCGVRALARRGKGPLALFFAAWVAIDLVMTFGFKTFYEHYLVVLYPACCILTGFLLDDLRVRGKRISSGTIAVFCLASFAVFAAYDCVGLRFARQQDRRLSALCARLSEILPKGAQVALEGGHLTSELVCRLDVRCPQRHFNAQMNHRFAGDSRRAEIVRELRATLDDPRTTHLLVEDREGFAEWTGFADALNLPHVEMDGLTVVLLKREEIK